MTPTGCCRGSAFLCRRTAAKLTTGPSVRPERLSTCNRHSSPRARGWGSHWSRRSWRRGCESRSPSWRSSLAWSPRPSSAGRTTPTGWIDPALARLRRQHGRGAAHVPRGRGARACRHAGQVEGGERRRAGRVLRAVPGLCGGCAVRSSDGRPRRAGSAGLRFRRHRWRSSTPSCSRPASTRRTSARGSSVPAS